MKKIFAYIFVSVALISCSKKDDGELGHHHHHHESEEAHSHDSSEIMLEPEMAEKFGLTTVEVQPSPFNSVIKVAGQIADSPSSLSAVSAPTSGIVTYVKDVVVGKPVGRGAVVATISAEGITGGNANAAARATLEAAQKEMERLKSLYDKRLVTADVYRQAELAYQQAKAAYSSGADSGRAIASQAGVISQLLVRQGEYVEAGAPIATISSVTDMTLRADVPERYYSILPTIAKARVAANGTVVEATRQGAAQAGASAKGYIPVYFTLANNGSLVPGAFVEVSLIGSPKADAMVLPLTALSEQQGAFFVYEQLDEECYRKLPVTVGASDGVNAEILSGIEPGQKIVSKGTVAVRLAESSTVVPEGHSHNH